MIFIYNCYGGTHSSTLASSIHLGLLPYDRVASKQEILDAPYFDKLNYGDMGKIIFRGNDRFGNSVYTLGRGTSKALVPALQNLMSVLNERYGLKGKVVFINASPTVPPLMTIGGFLSRGLKLHSLGRPLLALGAQHTYWNLVSLVKSTLEENGYKLEK